MPAEPTTPATGPATDGDRAPTGDGAAAGDGATPSVEGRQEADAPSSRSRLRRLAPLAVATVVLLAAFIGYLEWQGSKRVKIEDASLSAPQIPLPARAGGTLKQVYVSIGDDVAAHRPVARVGNEVIASDVAGTVVSVRDDIGASVPAGSTVATLMDRRKLRAAGLVDEDSGLAELRIGQRAIVKVDAFGGREFPGTVEEISDSPRRAGIAFSISNKDEVRQYEVKVVFDGVPYPGLKQGMSADIEVEK